MTDRYQGPIRLVLFDVDGVLTDGTLYIGEHGEVHKGFNVRDGLSVALLRAHGIKSGIISGKSSAALDQRINQLGFDVAVTGQLEKTAAYARITQELSLEDSQVLFVGDDVVDLPLIGVVGQFYAPSDAHPLVLAKADHVVNAPGGRGVAREVAEHLLSSGGLSAEQAYAPLLADWGGLHAAQ
ncbi:MAG: HAD-IIIA family hydrolase [Aeromicrobium sp.]|uniref:KdsC family phosphatase n=1 Tax=Aeromicrobium sp. TaxID=1871063 RepID=UPI0039E581A0